MRAAWMAFLPDPAPFVRFIPGFGNSSLDFTLICQVAEFTDQYLAQHELRKSIFARFRGRHRDSVSSKNGAHPKGRG
jgi:small-conductance mechanosensitive channel